MGTFLLTSAFLYLFFTPLSILFPFVEEFEFKGGWCIGVSFKEGHANESIGEVSIPERVEAFM